MVSKVDLKRELACYRARRDSPQDVVVPDLRYLMVDGRGDPNTPAFAAATAALYPIAYRLKSASRDQLGRDHVVMPLEGLWWADDHGVFTDARDRTRWSWTLMILVPDHVPAELVTAAIDRDDVRLETLREDRCVQALHVGPYDAEGPLIARLHEHARDRGLELTGRHHEIYLGDARRARPDRLRTILRQPVREPA